MSGFDIHHALDVAGRVSSTEATLVALLHDSVEDGLLSEYRLRQIVLPHIADAVIVLTRRDGETYDDYIQRVAADNWLVRTVKRADLRANLDRIDSEHRHLEQRWRDALAVLS